MHRHRGVWRQGLVKHCEPFIDDTDTHGAVPRLHDTGAVALWRAVLYRALWDVYIGASLNPIRYLGLVDRARARDLHLERNAGIDALLWFQDDAHDIGSFLWICDLLGMDPDWVRSLVPHSNTKRRQRP